MARVLSLVTFTLSGCQRDDFYERARTQLKPYWEAHGSERYEIYEEMGPTGPTGRLVELNILPDREAYLKMSDYVRQAQDLPDVAYRHVREPHFQVMELRV